MIYSLIGTNSVVQNTTAETAIFSRVVESSLLTVGKTINTRFFGFYSAVAVGPTITLRLRVGSSVASSIVLGTATTASLVAAQTNQGFAAETFTTVRQLGATGKAMTQGKLEYAIGLSAQNVANLVNTAEATVDWSVNQTIFATIQMSGANIANVVTTTNGVLIIE